MEFSNGARLHLRAAFRSADACRGLSANLLLVDEVQDVAAGDLPVLQETFVPCRTPSNDPDRDAEADDNHLEGMFTRSTANIWTIPCHGCGQGTTIDERCLGTTGPNLSDLSIDLDASQGAWVPLNPHSTWGQGFSISHPMVPWFKAKYSEILECQRNYDLVRFRNEVLGLPATLGDHVVTRAELEACCGSARMLQHGNHPMARPQHATVCRSGLGRRRQLADGLGDRENAS